MIRLAALAILLALATLLALLGRTEAGTAIAFSFVGHPLLVVGLGLYAYARWRPVEMSADERALYRLAFSSMGERAFVDLMALGTWGEASAGAHLLRVGERVAQIMVLLTGRVAAKLEGEEIGQIGPGELVGAALILTDTESWGEAVVVEPVRYFAWPIETLQPALEKNVALRAALQAIVSRDLAAKLREMTGGAAAD